MDALTGMLQWLANQNNILVVAILFLLAAEIGYRIGLGQAKRKNPDERHLSGVSAITAYMLGVVAFTVGRTIGFAQTPRRPQRPLLMFNP